MSTPRLRARWMRGALVGLCSAIVATGAHSTAGAELPESSALIVAALVCATVGAGLAGATLDGHLLRVIGVSSALGAAQVLGHFTLTIAAGHHHGGLEVTPGMITAHLIGAAVLGVAITVFEYLYVICTSLLDWLRLFAASAQRPIARPSRIVTNYVVAQSVRRCSGLGMRAPPHGGAAAA